MNYNVSNAIEVPTRTMFDIPITGPNATPDALSGGAVDRGLHDLDRLEFVRGRIGRSWMAVRDMDIAAELIGIRLYRTKLLAFAVSSFYCGVAGALMVFLWLGAAEADSFNINQSFIILFMVIIGGLGSLIGSFFGAAFIWGLPILLKLAPEFFGVAVQVRHGGTYPVHGGRRADYRVPDRRTARPCAALADRETEIEDVAFPVLRGQNETNSVPGHPGREPR